MSYLAPLPFIFLKLSHLFRTLTLPSPISHTSTPYFFPRPSYFDSVLASSVSVCSLHEGYSSSYLKTCLPKIYYYFMTLACNFPHDFYTQ
ncbi:uncharacterized protein BDZ99DRAFT_121119 [Mytilinidion resinicola]|uniref:Uncharacterized protein n=1 Tax=Mytilinidion resinicola TaxID=574789 RepID=A0A6A6Z3H8_9PEZI|nr:uncharacterized protein BDZ99DRAFT_121119 [Mytilinidion resinicola]KAF2815712.1 hypothetical protein BDZ99DRAFT_121119 [Mytilinidion resinicola]